MDVRVNNRKDQTILLLNINNEDTRLFSGLVKKNLDVSRRLYEYHDLPGALKKMRATEIGYIVLATRGQHTRRTQILRILRRNHPNLPVIALCFDNTEEQISQLFEAGAHDVLFYQDLSATLLTKTFLHVHQRQMNTVEAEQNIELANTISNNQREGILVINEKTCNVLFSNPAACRMLNTTSSKLQSKKCNLNFEREQVIEIEIPQQPKNKAILIKATAIEWRGKTELLLSMIELDECNKTSKLQHKEIYLKSLQQLSGTISHELAQPIQVMKLICEILRNEGVDLNYVDRLDSNCTIVNELVQKLRSVIEILNQSYTDKGIGDIRVSSALLEKLSISAEKEY
ncbi:MAG: hypothetical protein ACRBF0_17915 [Calditrichia bacterium]